MSYGINRTVAAAQVAVHALAAGLKAGSDGFQIADLFTLAPVLKDAIPVLANSKTLAAEIKDLDPGEIVIVSQTLETAIAKEFPPGHSREIATRAVAVIGPLAELGEAIMAARAESARIAATQAPANA